MQPRKANERRELKQENGNKNREQLLRESVDAPSLLLIRIPTHPKFLAQSQPGASRVAELSSEQWLTLTQRGVLCTFIYLLRCIRIERARSVRGNDENVMMAAEQHIVCKWSSGHEGESARRIVWRMWKKQTGAVWRVVLNWTTHGHSIIQAATTKSAWIYCAFADLLAQGRSRAEKFSEKGIKICFGFVFELSTASVTKESGADAYCLELAAENEMKCGVEQRKEMAKAGVAENRNCPVNAVALIDGDANVDGSWVGGHCMALCSSGSGCSSTMERRRAAGTGWLGERMKHRRAVDLLQKTLLVPEHARNMKEQTSRPRLSIDRPLCRQRSESILEAVAQRQLVRCNDPRQCHRIVGTAPLNVSASLSWSSEVHWIPLDSNASDAQKSTEDEPDEEDRGDEWIADTVVDAMVGGHGTMCNECARQQTTCSCHHIHNQHEQTEQVSGVDVAGALCACPRLPYAYQLVDRCQMCPSTRRGRGCGHPLHPHMGASASVGLVRCLRSRFSGRVLNQNEVPVRAEERREIKTPDPFLWNSPYFYMCFEGSGGVSSEFGSREIWHPFFEVCAHMVVRLRGGVRKAGFPVTVCT